MLKQFLVSIVLATLMFTSIVLWAQNGEAGPSQANLEVTKQLSISDYTKGDESYIVQVNEAAPIAEQAKKEHVLVPEVAVFWVLFFALMVFVVRLSRRRLK